MAEVAQYVSLLGKTQRRNGKRDDDAKNSLKREPFSNTRPGFFVL